MCGGDLDIQAGTSVAVCQYCGSKQTLPKLDNDKKMMLYDRANHFRRNSEFDKAMSIYEQILNEDNTDAEAYWSIVLCRYGIEYVEDPAIHKRVPTVNRTQYTSIFDDEDYKSALHYADDAQKEVYENEAKTINEIQKGILAISQQEEPFDVFICYKETDSQERRTPDSVLANDLYYQLTQEGFKVFFSRITLEDKLGTAYEPYIFAALNSAKVMVVLGTKPEYFNAAWVKNEWSRYLALIKNGEKKILIPAYKDMDPYDLPEEFAHLQAQDMSKLGFMQDLIRGIKKITAVDVPKVIVKETVTQENNVDPEVLLKRVKLFLMDEKWINANQYCEKVLDIEPENAQAYLYMLMSELRVKKEDDLKHTTGLFINNKNYKKIMLFGNNEIKARIEELCNINSYNIATQEMQIENYAAALNVFKVIPDDFKDTANQILICENKLSEIKKEYENLYIIKMKKQKEIDERYGVKNKCRKKQNKFVIPLFSFLGFVLGGSILFFTYNFSYNDTIFVISNILMYSSLIILIANLIANLIKNIIQNKKNEKYTAALTEIENEYKPTPIMVKNLIDVPPIVSNNNSQNASIDNLRTIKAQAEIE